MRNSRIILAKNIKMDKEYNNVLNYTEEEMLGLVTSKDHLVNRADNYSFIKEGKIAVGFSFAECMSSNYIAFENQEYYNKWFFGWITDVKYISDKTVEISYKVDAFSTWYSKLNIKACYVEREHTNDDTIGKNTYPETLETGEYIIQDEKKIGLSDTCICIASTWDSYKNQATTTKEYNGIFSGVSYFVFKSTDYSNPPAFGPYDSAAYFLSALDVQAKADACQAVFLIPKKLVDYDNIKWDFPEGGSELKVYFYKELPATENTKLLSDIAITKNYNDINGYIPKNKKLFCYPYNCLVLNNNTGSSTAYNYEDFTTNSCNFKTFGVVSIGCSITTVPENYKGSNLNYEETITSGKYPSCNWQSDSFTNWMTQNSVNINGVNVPLPVLTSLAGTAGQVGKMFLGEGATSMMNRYFGTEKGYEEGELSTSGLASSIMSSMISKYQHSLVPPTARGNINNGDVLTANKQNDITIYKKTIKKEYAKKIDDYFSRVGYKIAETKIPNITGRKEWNYVEIGKTEQIGYGEIPQNYLETINNIFRKGTTIWHNAENIGNFELDNSIK